jgi:hypothetical protein
MDALVPDFGVRVTDKGHLTYIPAGGHYWLLARDGSSAFGPKADMSRPNPLYCHRQNLMLA